MACFAGCFGGVAVPPPPKGTMTLKYFPITGRAEPIRLALHLGKHKYKDERINTTQWQDMKQDMPWQQLPVLVLSGPTRTIAQTKAILRYIGKLTKYNGHLLYPQDPLLAAQVDETLDAFDDLWLLIAPTFRIKDQLEREKARQDLFEQKEGEAALIVASLERTLARSTTGLAVPEAGFTLADLVYFCFLNTIRSGFIGGLTPAIFQDYPNIVKHREKIASMPEIKSYYSDPAKSNPSNVPFYEVFQPGK